MNFLIFRDFSELILRFLMIKTIKIKAKKGFIFARDPRGCNVARKATWQRHAGPHGAYAAQCDVHIYIYRNYMGYSTYKHSVFRITQTFLIFTHYIPDAFSKFLPCETKFHIVFKMQGTWLNKTHRIEGASIKMRGSCGLAVHRSSIKHMCFKGVIRTRI